MRYVPWALRMRMILNIGRSAGLSNPAHLARSRYWMLASERIRSARQANVTTTYVISGATGAR